MRFDPPEQLGKPFGILVESHIDHITVLTKDADVAIGDLFLLPCCRMPKRFYFFRASACTNATHHPLDPDDTKPNKTAATTEEQSDESLLVLNGTMLGYSQYAPKNDTWTFQRLRRFPFNRSKVFHVDPSHPAVVRMVRELLQSQLGKDGIYLGNLLVGETSLRDVPVYLPPFALSRHIGIFGRSGSGKSHLMMVLLASVMQHNQNVRNGDHRGSSVSIFAIDPHDEFRNGQAFNGLRGIRDIVNDYSKTDLSQLVEPFYYLSARDLGNEGLERHVHLSRADITPDDLASIMTFSDQQKTYANQLYEDQGENWIGRLLSGDVHFDGEREDCVAFPLDIIAAVQRHIEFLGCGSTRVVTRFDPEMDLEYESSLPDILCALEQGRCLLVETTLMSESEQFLLNAIVARTLFGLRRALRAATTPKDLREEIRRALHNNEDQGQVGMRSLADEMIARLESGDLPYLTEDGIRLLDELPHVNIVIEEASRILNAKCMRERNIFRDLGRQGYKFGIGLTVISQQVTPIDKGILSQLNTEITFGLGNADERRAAVRNASGDLGNFTDELSVLERGQMLISSSLTDMIIPVQVPADEPDPPKVTF
ncbi:MAG: ATP-binding protein [Myxococcota bacterium]|nr:ATP-binding protein [Myxococcota bacterium]